jgi:hypothetical protein
VKVRQQLDDNCEAGRRIEVRIEELVLAGFAPADRHRIARAVQQELAKRLRQSGVPESIGNPSALASIDGGGFHIPAGAPPRMIGVGIGASIYRGLQQNRVEKKAQLAQLPPGGHPR